jgi:hypothetical protein
MTNMLGIDGRIDVGKLPPDGCCPPSICNIDPCDLVCNLVNTLPSGPLWDQAKLEALSVDWTIGCNNGCTSMVLHAVYVAQLLHLHLMAGLWPAVRESNPATAYDTLDEWLERLGWQNCFKCACECIDDPSELPPFQLLQPDGSTVCCPDEAPAGLTRAVKRGIAVALWRLRLGVIRNIDSINFVLSSLSAEVTVVRVDGQPKLTVCNVGDTIAGACADMCLRETCAPVQSYWLLGCNGVGDNRRIYPGVLAAQCIVRSLISNRQITLTRC